MNPSYSKGAVSPTIQLMHTNVPELTVCLIPADVSQVQLPRVPRGANWVSEGTRFLKGVFDLHHLLPCDQRVSAKIWCGKTGRVMSSLGKVNADPHVF